MAAPLKARRDTRVKNDQPHHSSAANQPFGKDMVLIRVVGWLLLHPTAPEISQVR